MSRPNPEHPRPWHREAVYGDGPRRILSARERDEFGHVLGAFARAGLIPPGTVWTGLALRDFLDWTTGQCNPSHAALGQHVRDHYGRRSDRTIERDLVRLRDLGAVTWEQLLVRVGPWRSEQTSNAYCLHPDADGTPRVLPIPTRPRSEQPAAKRVGPRTPWAQPVPTYLESSDPAAETGGPRVPPAARTAQSCKHVGPRRGPGFSDTLSAGDRQPTPILDNPALEAALVASRARGLRAAEASRAARLAAGGRRRT